MLRTFLAVFALGLTACPEPPDDDDSSSDDDDVAVPDDDDDATSDDDDSVVDDDDSLACGVVISGAIVALDRESGAVLTAADYAARAGGLILYLLPDPTDLSVIYDKITMTGPGPYSLDLDGCEGSASVVAVVDQNRDFIISSADVAREHAFNPVLLPERGTMSGIDVYVDLPRVEGTNGDDDDASGPGDDDDDASGPGDDDDTAGPVTCPSSFSGEVVVTDLPPAAVVVTANAADLLSGPWAVVYLPEPGAFTLDVPCDVDGTAFVGILDADRNGFFEPSDPVGGSDNNPWTLGLPPATGVQIEIPGLEDVAAPSPLPYAGIGGTVIFDDFLTGDILVHASAVYPGGQLYSMATLAAPGPFSLIAPPGSTDVLVWAALDADGDGVFDVYSDPFDSFGPFDLEQGATGIELVLDQAPPGPGTISGTVLSADPAEPGSCLRVALFDQEPSSPSIQPTMTQPAISAPTFPAAYSFAGVPAGQWWVAAYLDLGCDNEQGPGVEDIDGRVDWPVQLPGDSDVAGVDLTLGG